jgi:hypothetical protein
VDSVRLTQGGGVSLEVTVMQTVTYPRWWSAAGSDCHADCDLPKVVECRWK